MVSPTNSNILKSAIRSTIRGRLKQLSPEYIHAQSQLIAKELVTLPAYKEAKGVCLFMSLPHEVDTMDIIRHALSHGKAIFLPKVISDTEMHMYRVYSLHDVLTLPTGKWGISEPAPRVKASELRPRELDPDAWKRLKGADGLPLPPPAEGCGVSNIRDLPHIDTAHDNLRTPWERGVGREQDISDSLRQREPKSHSKDDLPFVEGICERLGVTHIARVLGLLEQQERQRRGEASGSGDEAEVVLEEWIDRSEACADAAQLVDMVVMPGCAFDVHRQRLGYGRGYYDRYVKRLREKRIELNISPPTLVGVCLEEQVVGEDGTGEGDAVTAQAVPLEAHDEPVDYVVTPRRVL